jgi:hypothetical protein
VSSQCFRTLPFFSKISWCERINGNSFNSHQSVVEFSPLCIFMASQHACVCVHLQHVSEKNKWI